MRTVLRSLSVLAVGAALAVPTISSGATKTSVASYPLGVAKTCKVDYVKKTERENVTVKVKGKMVTESKRYVACVYVTPAKAPAPTTTVVAPTPSPAPPATPSPTPTTTVSTPTVAAPPVGPTEPASSGGSSGGGSPASTTTTTVPLPTLGVTFDPTFTQGANNPLDVTYTFSATANLNGQSEPSLPGGVLDFYSDGSLSCSVSVGGNVNSGQCVVIYSTYGSHSVVTEYLSGGETATTGTEVETIEPFTTTLSTGTVTVTGSTVESNYAYSILSIPVTVSGITSALGTTGTISLTNSDASNLSCTTLTNYVGSGDALGTCTAYVENDPAVTTSWAPDVSFSGDSNYNGESITGSSATIPVAPAPAVTDVTVTIQCDESGGFCSEYQSSPETTDARVNVFAGNPNYDISPGVGTVSFTSADHLAICSATVEPAYLGPDSAGRCVGQGGPFEGPISVSYSGGTVETGDTQETVYSSATTSGGSN